MAILGEICEEKKREKLSEKPVKEELSNVNIASKFSFSDSNYIHFLLAYVPEHK